MSVTYPRGFRAAGMSAGLKPSGRPDLGLLVGDPGTTVAGLFTTNRVAAAPVELSRARIAEGHGRAVIVNSGQANAATGERGDADAQTIVSAAAAALGVDAADVLACSTGVIGEPVHVEPLLAALPILAGALTPEGGSDFARAIMTTDTVDKQATADAGGFRVGGCAKGVGMIAPNLATMLVFVTTDAAGAPGPPAAPGGRAAEGAVQRADRRRVHQHERHGAAVRERCGAGRRRGRRPTRPHGTSWPAR